MKLAVRVLCLVLVLSTALGASVAAGRRPSASTYPIKHVVVIFQENNSFDHLLGKLCVDEDNRCDGTTEAKLLHGKTIPLHLGGDIPPAVAHSVATTRTAIHHGLMDGWERIPQCTEAMGYACLEEDDRSRIPTLAALADQFVISDRTFQLYSSASWGSHLDLVSADLSGFTGDNPDSGFEGEPGWGCDSGGDAPWKDPNTPHAKVTPEPACIPNKQGAGPYRPSPVQYVPTIMDRLDAAGPHLEPLRADAQGSGGYGWAICPTFYECLGTKQAQERRQCRPTSSPTRRRGSCRTSPS